MNESLSRDKAALTGAMESRKQKEKKAKDAENKLNEEKNKPRKGLKTTAMIIIQYLKQKT